MGIIIALVLIFIVLSFGGLAVRFLLLSGLRKIKEKKSPESTQETQSLPEISEISDEKLKKELTSLKILTWVRKLTIPALVVIGLLILFLNWEIGTSKSLDEVFLEILLPIALVFVLSVATFIFASNRINKLKALMGSAVTLPMIKELFDVKSYRSNGHIDREIVASAGLVGEWERIEGSDFFEGSYRNVSVLYSDICLSHEETDTDSDGKKTTKNVTDFLGQWLVCDFGKELSASVRLIERKGGTRFHRTNDRSKTDVETENAAFNKKYRIVTGDGHSAFYLLTPHFMERLLSADEMADASTLFCFGNGKVHIAMNSGRDSFEISGVSLGNIENVRQKFRGELKFLTNIIDELLLNEKLFQ